MILTNYHLIRKVCTLGVCLLSLSAFAAEPDKGEGNYNFGYVSIGGGYSSLSQEIDQAHVNGSFAWLGGIGYEFRCHGFWLSAGAQYLFKRSSLSVNEYHTPEIAGIDDLGEDVMLSYYINQKDQQNWTTVDLPILLGYYYKGFYVGAGAKVGLSFGAFSKTTGTYELQGRYNNGMIIRNFGYYTTYETENKVSCKLLPEIAILGEIGYDLLSTLGSHSTICHLLKLGFYVEYGVNNIRPKNSMDPIVLLNYKDATQVAVNPYAFSTKNDGQKLSAFVVGIKLTYLIGGSRSAVGTWHKGCQCYGD